MRRSRALDPELAALATLIPTLDLRNIDEARNVERTVVAEMRRGTSTVTVEPHRTTRPDGSALAMALHRPKSTPRGLRTRSALGGAGLPVLVFLHGGSFITGGLHTEEERCQHYADAAGCAVLTVDYRLAPEHPYPAGLDDCALALQWLGENSGDLDLDATRVVVGGLSAGAALAAGVALRWRDARRDQDREQPQVDLVLQMLLHPVLDGMLRTTSMRLFDDTPLITGPHMRTCWAMYLGVNPGDDAAYEAAAERPSTAYASPGRVADLTGLPPVYLSAAEFDPLRDEALTHAVNLLGAGVPVELHHYARAFHSFDSFSATRMGRTALVTQVEALCAAFR